MFNINVFLIKIIYKNFLILYKSLYLVKAKYNDMDINNVFIAAIELTYIKIDK